MSAVERLGTLAERINAEHRAYETSIKTALGHLDAALWHALDAGDLLLQAKAEQKHGTWEDWLKANFKTLSVRRAQEYMFLARGRADLEEVKARGSAFSSIENALEFLRLVKRAASEVRPEGVTVAPGPPIPGVTVTELPIEAKARRAKEREVQKLLPWAEYSLRMGNHLLMGNIKATPEGRQRAIERALEMRREHLPNVVDALAHQLDILAHTVEPEDVGRYLTEHLTGQRNDPDGAEQRADMLAELREGLPWLQRVLDEAEGAQGRMQSGE